MSRCWSGGCAVRSARRRCSASAPAPRWPARAPRPSSASRWPSWPPGSSAPPIPAGQHRRGDAASRHRRATPIPTALRARLAQPDPDELGGAPQPTRWPSGPSRHFGLRDRRRGQAGPQAADPATATAAEKLHDETGADEAVCGTELQRPAAGRLEGPRHQGRPLFAFKLHQFIGKGDTVYVTLEPPDKRYLTTQYQRSAPTGAAGQPLFPLAFCRECGQDFLVGQPRARRRELQSPHAQRRTRGEQADGRPGCCSSPTSRGRHPTTPRCSTWSPRTGWSTDAGADSSRSRPAATGCPTALRVDEFGTITDDGTAGGVLRAAATSARRARPATRAPGSRSSPAWPAWAPRAAPAP